MITEAARGDITSATGSSEDALAQAFRLAMRRIASTVHLITAVHEGRRFGMTATAVSSLSFEPHSLIICVNRSATLHDPLHAGDCFCINTLAEGQEDIAGQFGSSKLQALRFTTGEWWDMDNAPALAGAQSNILCSTQYLTHVSTHSIFAGTVLGVRTCDVPPLVYRDGGYCSVA